MSLLLPLNSQNASTLDQIRPDAHRPLPLESFPPFTSPIPLSLRVIYKPPSRSHLILKFGICPERPDPCLLELRMVTLLDQGFLMQLKAGQQPAAGDCVWEVWVSVPLHVIGLSGCTLTFSFPNYLSTAVWTPFSRSHNQGVGYPGQSIRNCTEGVS